MRLIDIVLLAHAKDSAVAGIQKKVAGLAVTIEHAKGTQRLLHDDKGAVVYRVHMHNDYGFFNGTKGRDGDEVDCFLGPIANPKEIYVVHMKDMGPVPKEREDEDKCMVGFPSADAAKAAFLLHYPPTFYDGMSVLSTEKFKESMATASKPYRRSKITAAGNIYSTQMCDMLAAMIEAPRGMLLLMCSGVGPALVRACGCDKDMRSAGKKCPHCGSKKYALMPTDFETAKCAQCGKNFQASIHQGAQVEGMAAQKAEIDRMIANLKGGKRVEASAGRRRGFRAMVGQFNTWRQRRVR